LFALPKNIFVKFYNKALERRGGSERVRHEAGGLLLMGLDCNPTPITPARKLITHSKSNNSVIFPKIWHRIFTPTAQVILNYP